MRTIIASLFFILIFTFLALVASSVVSSQELSIKEATVSADAKATKSVEYTLPYPGLLPDNPLYFLKAARDRIVGLLISDPLKKAEFNLLAADKRLNSGIFLFKKGKEKHALAFSTISKGENYFEEAIAKVREAKKQRLDTNDILRRLSDSSYKHQEAIRSFEKISSKDFKEGFVSLQKRTEDFKKQVDLLRTQK